MKIELDCIVEEKGRYVAYIKLKDKDGNTLANAIVPYEEGKTELLKQAAINKFRSKAIEQINKEVKMGEIKSALESALLEIDIEKEVIK